MEVDKTQILFWLKEFKRTWLPETISKDTHLLESIIRKLGELEQLLKINESDENTTDDFTECSLVTSLEKTDEKDDETEETTLTRPAIQIKRISLAEAELYMPVIWQNTMPSTVKRGRKMKMKRSPRISNRIKNKRNIQADKVVLSNATDDKIEKKVTVAKTRGQRTRSNKLVHLPSTSSVVSVQSNGEEKRQAKRKLRAMDAEDDDLCTLANLSSTNIQNGDNHCDPITRYIGQNGILSQTRKNNETSTMIDDEFLIKSQPTTSITIPEPDLTPIPDDDPIVDNCISQPVIENNNNNNDVSDALNITHDRTFETSSNLTGSNNHNNSNGLYNDDGIEDISNDGIDPPTARPLTMLNLPQLPLTT